MRACIVAAGKALGHSLPQGSVVHHVDGNRKNNTNQNLVILQSRQEHIEIHRKLRVLRAGGNPWTDYWCSGCQTPKLKEKFCRVPGTCDLCNAANSHRLWCKKNGRPLRYLTPEERSEQNRQLAFRRWRKVG